LGRISVRVKGEGTEALLKLSRAWKTTPDQVVQRLVISTLNSLQDDELCNKLSFPASIVFALELPFAFPYECEVFEIQSGFNIRIYLERVPKRYVIDRLPFRTLASIVIEITPEEKKDCLENVLKAREKLKDKYSSLAFQALRALLISYRRTTKDYYNIGPIDHPSNPEEFLRRARMTVVIDSRELDSVTFMPVGEESLVVVKHQLEKEIRWSVINQFVEIMADPHKFLSGPMGYLDAAWAFYYREQWDICLLLSVIGMETGTSRLIFDSSYANPFIEKEGGVDILRQRYRDAQGLPKRIQKFLLPTFHMLSQDDAISELKRIMPQIHNERLGNGIYDLRSKLVHEGVSVTKEKAKEALDVSHAFVAMIASFRNGLVKS